LEILDKGKAPLPGVIIWERYLLLFIIMQMGHDQRDMTDCGK
jgi:hypothetical protein